jgi:site-specific recombinase XerD
MDDLIPGFESVLRAQGLAVSTILHNIHCCATLVKLHVDKGAEVFDRNIVASYTRSIQAKYENGEIGRHHCSTVMRNVGRFMEYVESGEVKRDNPLKGSRYTLLPEFERIADAYLSSGEFHPNTSNDMRWVTHKYFAWLMEQGFANLRGVGAEHLQRFLVDCSKQLSPNSMHNVKLFLKKLYAHLYELELSESPFTALLSFRVNRETKIYPCMPQSDIVKMLAAIDRSTVVGKRAYAAMILGAELGLRACDVVSLELTDIDWINGEIRIVQAKTGRAVILPLTTSVGEALRDYILNGRPKVDFKQIFIKINRPYTPVKAAVTIGEIYRDCCIAAGIESSKRFHNLRRSLGTAMITNGVSVETAAQVFGDSQMNSMKQYIALDTKHLKSCALPFDGIAPIGGNA